MNIIVLITTRELTYEIAIFPLFTIFVMAIFYWLFSRLVYKISVDDSKMIIEQEKKTIKIKWCDIGHIYVGRKWGLTKLKIKISNADINLPRRSFQLLVGSGSDEGEKRLVRALKKISNFTELKFNNRINNMIKFWNKFDV